MVVPHSSPPLCNLRLDESKAEARRLALARREGCDPGLGAALAEHLLREAPPPPGTVIAGFWPMGPEIDIRPLLLALAERGHPIALPFTPQRGLPLAFRRWRPGDVLARGPLGTSHPAMDDPLTPGCFLVPLLAFDRAGRRLGYGGGYYDRTLPIFPDAPRIGCAYAPQELPEVPAGPLDVRLTMIATELGVIRCKG
jgi:5-formyltetrahydrofolate cyclo-ligase